MSKLSENISRKDKDNLIIATAIIFFISFIFAIHFGFTLVPWEVSCGLAVLVQMLYTVPQITLRYYSLNKMKASWQRFIPIWNELMVCSTTIAKLSLVLLTLTILVGLATMLPLSVVGAIFGMHTTIAWGYNCSVAAIILSVITHLTIAVGLSGMYRNTNIMIYQCIGEKTIWWVELVYYVVLFVPFVQLATLLAVSRRQNTLINFGYGLEEKAKYVEDN